LEETMKKTLLLTIVGLAIGIPAAVYRDELLHAADKAATIGSDDTPTSQPVATSDLTELTRIMLARRAAALDASKREDAAVVEAFLAEAKRRDKELDDWLAKEQAKLGKPAAKR
jgi:hypothetical protein